MSISSVAILRRQWAWERRRKKQRKKIKEENALEKRSMRSQKVKKGLKRQKERERGREW